MRYYIEEIEFEKKIIFGMVEEILNNPTQKTLFVKEIRIV